MLQIGTILTAAFTFMNAERYSVYAMILLAAAAAAAAVAADTPNSASPPTPVVAEATATVRIVAGVRLKLDSPENHDAPRAHDATISADGNPRHARLIEFE
jgi:hypothetical protein